VLAAIVFTLLKVIVATALVPPQLNVINPPPESLLEKSASLLQFVTTPLAHAVWAFSDKVTAVNMTISTSRGVYLGNIENPPPRTRFVPNGNETATTANLARWARAAYELLSDAASGYTTNPAGYARPGSAGGACPAAVGEAVAVQDRFRPSSAPIN
jgi:hypothetical protein